MKLTVKRCGILLFLLAAVLCLTSCGRNGGRPSRKLEGIFRGTPLILPEGERPLSSVLPYTDEENGSILCAAGKETGSGSALQNDVTIYACTPDGDTVTALRSFAVRGSILSGSVTAEGAVLATMAETAGGNREYRLVRALGGDVISEADLGELLPPSVSRDFYGAAEDKAGNIYLLAQNAAVVLAPDQTCRLLLNVPRGERLLRDSDGSVWVMFFEKTLYKLARIDPDSGGFAETVTLPTGTSAVWFGRGADYYYAVTSGIFCHRKGEKDRILLHYVNSGLSSTSARILAIPDAEHVLLIRHRADIEADLLSMYRKAGEEELRKTVMVIACANKISNRFYEKILLFNEAHDDIHVSVNDYSVYNTDEDPDGGSRRLSVDILTGAYAPDLIAGTYQMDASMKMCVEKKLYADLKPYLTDDPEVNTETVFPSLLRVYDDGDGGIWGLTNRFSLELLAGNRSMLGKAADAGKWSVRELLDFYDTLPEGTELIWQLLQTNANQVLLGSEGFGAFIDFKEGTCSFEGEDFLRYLRLLLSLPANPEEYERRSPLASTPKEERYHLYHEGKLILQRIRMTMPGIDQYLQLKLFYPDGDAVPIGYPTSGESGILIRTETSWLITSFSENKDAAWQLLRFLVKEEQKNELSFCPALIPDFDEYVKPYYDTEFLLYYNGTSEGHPVDPEHPTTERDLKTPGIVARFTEEDREALKAMIAGAGTPMISRVPEEVQEIIDEEISGLLGDVSTPESCAKKIQSRVSIWLAEHK